MTKAQNSKRNDDQCFKNLIIRILSLLALLSMKVSSPFSFFDRDSEEIEFNF